MFFYYHLAQKNDYKILGMSHWFFKICLSHYFFEPTIENTELHMIVGSFRTYFERLLYCITSSSTHLKPGFVVFGKT